MRALCFSDLHRTVSAAAQLAERAVAERVDVMLSAGDLAIDFVHSPLLYEALARAGKPVFCVPGNHDGVATYDSSLAAVGFTDIDGRALELGGVVFAGWGYRWAEPAPAAPGWRDPPPSYPGRRPDPELGETRALVAGADPRRTVLVSHLPPWGVRVARTASGDDLGDRHLRRWVNEFQPAAVVCGHVHLPRPMVSRVGNTLVVNGGREGWILQL
jgi:Icc-related predicted phosphoesterase